MGSTTAASYKLACTLLDVLTTMVTELKDCDGKLRETRVQHGGWYDVTKERELLQLLLRVQHIVEQQLHMARKSQLMLDDFFWRWDPQCIFRIPVDVFDRGTPMRHNIFEYCARAELYLGSMQKELDNLYHMSTCSLQVCFRNPKPLVQGMMWLIDVAASCQKMTESFVRVMQQEAPMTLRKQPRQTNLLNYDTVG